MACSSMNRAALIVDESGLSQDTGMAERVAPGLRINTEAVRSLADRNPSQQVAVGRIERINLRVVAAREPQHLVVRRYATHVGAATAGDLPLRRHLPRGDIDDRDGSFAAV